MKKGQQAMMESPAYKPILADREKLPAWKERDRITSALEANRVLVVVGEVSGITL